MRLAVPLAAALLATLTTATYFAQERIEPATGREGDPLASLPPAEAALEHLLSERGTPEQLSVAIQKAKELGVGEQAILEARFLYHVDRREDAQLAALLPEFLKRKETFKIEESGIFAVEEDWLAVVEYLLAIDAVRKGDRDAFKKHITEAFWLSPRQGAAFAPHIDRMRLDDAMRGLRIEATTKLASLRSEDSVELGSLMKSHKALLLHFWSPWSRECEASMPDFAATAKELEAHDIAVASLLAESSAEAASESKEFLSKLDEVPPGQWLRDRETNSLLRMLRIQDLPAMVLVSPEGRILFNGHPSEVGLWEALAQIAPDAQRPSLEEH